MSEAVDLDLGDNTVPFEASAPVRRPRKQAKVEPDTIGARALPHSLQAESCLLSCCMVDSATMLPRCIERGVIEDTFYDPAHRLLWVAMRELYEARREIATFTLAEYLYTAESLERVGGVAFIESVANAAATLAHAHEYLAVVIDRWTRRKLARRLAVLQESLHQKLEPAEVEAAMQSIREDLAAVADDTDTGTPLADFKYPVDDPNVLLGTRYRWISRGGQLLIVGFSGSGKSSTCYQSATHWGIGRDFLGINCVRPLKILIVQAEDDAGDIGEVVESVKQGCNLTPEEFELFRRNVIVRTHKTSAGERFLFWLGAQCRKIQPDLVYINPLFNYIAGSVSDDDVCNEFYNGLNRINPDDRWAYVIFHHTPKPPREEGSGSKTSLTKQYGGHGSAVLTNRPRATIIIEPSEDDRRFTWVLAKRGRRAGVVERVPHGAVEREEIVTKIHARHSDRRIQVNGISYPMILWERDTQAPEPKAKSESRPMRTSTNIPDDRLVGVFPIGRKNAWPAQAVHREVRCKLGSVSERALMAQVMRLVDSGAIVHDGVSGKYYRPSFDDGPPTLDPEVEPLARVPGVDSPPEPDQDSQPY